MTEERFKELWDECSREDKFSMFKNMCAYEGCDEEVYDFDDEFFNVFFSNNPMEAARATCFGDVTWNHPYIRFDGYGNLQSMDEYDVEELCDEYVSTIFERKEYWEDYIEDEEDEWKEDAEDTLISVFEGTANLATINTFVNEQWDEDEDDETNIIEFRKWFQANRMDEGGKYKLVLDEDATDKVTSSFEEDIDYDIAAHFVKDSWDYDMSDEDNIKAFADWYEDMNGEKLTYIE
jgi:hypothetical protein